MGAAMKIFFAFVISLFLALPALACTLPETGKAAPAFTLPDQDGKQVSLSDFKGKWLVLYFYPKDFTGGCSLEAHNFQRDIDKFTALNATIVGVSTDTAESHKKFCDKEKLSFSLLPDTEAKTSMTYASTMGHDKKPIISARNTFLIDPEGVLRKTYLKVDPASHSEQVLADLEGLQKKL